MYTNMYMYTHIFIYKYMYYITALSLKIDKERLAAIPGKIGLALMLTQRSWLLA